MTTNAPPIPNFALTEETHTRRQIALRLLPLLFLLYIVNFLDRTSLAYGAIGMARDLGFTDHVFGLGFGIFFIGYITLQIPCAMPVESWSARKIICISMVTWGALTGLSAMARSPNQLYLARFLLGAAEAGFFPGVVVASDRITCGWMDFGPCMVGRRRVALVVCGGGGAGDCAGRRGVFAADGHAAKHAG